MEIFWNVLPNAGKAVFLKLKNIPELQSFYLAGGTALALQLGHRISADLDFFSATEFNEERLANVLTSFGDFQLEKKERQIILGILGETKISFFHYPHPHLNPLIETEGTRLASLLDLGCMKLDAVSSRGTKRDFVDLYFLLREHFILSELLKNFEQKYIARRYNLSHVKKSLVYFVDAEAEPLPKMLQPIEWSEIKKFFEHEIKKLSI